MGFPRTADIVELSPPSDLDFSKCLIGLDGILRASFLSAVLFGGGVSLAAILDEGFESCLDARVFTTEFTPGDDESLPTELPDEGLLPMSAGFGFMALMAGFPATLGLAVVGGLVAGVGLGLC